MLSMFPEVFGLAFKISKIDITYYANSHIQKQNGIDNNINASVPISLLFKQSIK